MVKVLMFVPLLFLHAACVDETRTVDFEQVSGAEHNLPSWVERTFVHMEEPPRGQDQELWSGEVVQSAAMVMRLESRAALRELIGFLCLPSGDVPAHGRVVLGEAQAARMLENARRVRGASTVKLPHATVRVGGSTWTAVHVSGQGGVAYLVEATDVWEGACRVRFSVQGREPFMSPVAESDGHWRVDREATLSPGQWCLSVLQPERESCQTVVLVGVVWIGDFGS